MTDGRCLIMAFIGFWDFGKEVQKDSFWERKDLLAQKSSISFVTTLVPFFMLQNSKLPWTVPLRCFCN
jgi:hypothetical protein